MQAVPTRTCPLGHSERHSSLERKNPDLHSVHFLTDISSGATSLSQSWQLGIVEHAVCHGEGKTNKNNHHLERILLRTRHRHVHWMPSCMASRQGSVGLLQQAGHSGCSGGLFPQSIECIGCLRQHCRRLFLVLGVRMDGTDENTCC